MQFFIYQSRALIPPTQKNLAVILASSLRNNAPAGLTGFFHSEADMFLQYLEGPPEPLVQTISRIKDDPRHDSFVMLGSGPLTARRFPDWQMGLSADGLISLADVFGMPATTLSLTHLHPKELISFFAMNAGMLRTADQSHAANSVGSA